MTTDEQIKQKIEDELFWDSRIDDSKINVEVEDGIVKLYNGAKDNVPAKSFLNDLSQTLQKLPDNHLKIGDGNNLLFSSEREKPSVGSNIEQEKSWSITTSKDGRNVGIVAIPKIGSTSLNDWIEFADSFKKEAFNEKGTEKWSSIIIDNYLSWASSFCSRLVWIFFMMASICLSVSVFSSS